MGDKRKPQSWPRGTEPCHGSAGGLEPRGAPLLAPFRAARADGRWSTGNAVPHRLGFAGGHIA